jgi:hypothetical protein
MHLVHALAVSAQEVMEASGNSVRTGWIGLGQENSGNEFWRDHAVHCSQEVVPLGGEDGPSWAEQGDQNSISLALLRSCATAASASLLHLSAMARPKEESLELAMILVSTVFSRRLWLAGLLLATPRSLRKSS